VPVSPDLKAELTISLHEFSFSHLVGGEPEACSISHVTNSANFAPML
jgi:hypothetical protein